MIANKRKVAKPKYSEDFLEAQRRKNEKDIA